jgi:small subunit ribosomal protein S16
MGNKHRPFYRIVVTNASSKRDGKFIENLGTYNSLTKPSTVVLNKERALHWLLQGAQPTETTAYLLKREGVLEEFFSQRPKAKGQYSFLEKNKQVAVTPSAPVAEAAPVAEETAPAEEAPAAEEATTEEATS